MSDYNLAVIVGKLQRDPQLHYSEDGNPYSALALEVARSLPDANGTIQKTVTLIDVQINGHQAEIACQRLIKGSSVLVAGSFVQRGRSLGMKADRIQFLDKRSDEDATKEEEVKP